MSLSKQGEKQLIQDLVVSYSMRQLDQPYSYVTQVGITTHYDWVWECHRYATKTYEYRGMSYDDAKEKAQSIVSSYTRSKYDSVFNSDDGVFEDRYIGRRLQTSVSVQQMVGCMYKIVVQVNEDDMKLQKPDDVNFTQAFSNENSRTYDF